ncbi:hypothetical protein [Labilibacter marinus]|uniref:hypothetical protein n=1 Tax=Labilibacter marinus TaxID=1477105 RepID=UPI0009502759|nr:hypothetical protein [Labilibacter marinus]
MAKKTTLLSLADGLFIFAYSNKNETKSAAAAMKKLKISILRGKKRTHYVQTAFLSYRYVYRFSLRFYMKAE